MPKLFQIDSFTQKLFAGNPAGVCILEKPRSEEWMRNVAQEMNLSETAFLVEENGGLSLRFFTPTVELDLCGHATLATAHALWESGAKPRSETLLFQTLSGVLKAKNNGDSISLFFPLEVTQEAEALDAVVQKSFGLTEVPLSIVKTKKRYLIEVSSEDAVVKTSPDFASMQKQNAPDFVVTCKVTNSQFDFVSRVFAPSHGVPEDPVTGAAHCALVDFWSKKTGQTSFRARQASKRGGEMDVVLHGEIVELRGKALTFFSTEIA